MPVLSPTRCRRYLSQLLTSSSELSSQAELVSGLQCIIDPEDMDNLLDYVMCALDGGRPQSSGRASPELSYMSRDNAMRCLGEPCYLRSQIDVLVIYIPNKG
jgi:hypothetical protein